MNQTTDASREAACPPERRVEIAGYNGCLKAKNGEFCLACVVQATGWTYKGESDRRRWKHDYSTKQPMPLSEDEAIRAMWAIDFGMALRECIEDAARGVDSSDLVRKAAYRALFAANNIKPTSDNTSTLLAEALEVIKESRECILALSRAATEYPVKQYKNSMYEALCLADKVSQRAERFMNGG